MAHKITTAALAAASLTATGAFAGGIERTNQSPRVLFETGTYAELSFGLVEPTVSGVASSVSPTPDAASGNMSPSFFQRSFAFKNDLNERISYAVIFDQPFGADVDYPAGTGYFAGGAVAELNTSAFTALFQYNANDNVSVYGGPRYQRFEAEAIVPFVTPSPGVTPPYEAVGEKDGGVGFVLGTAYEMPEIAMRVSLTYNSSIEHDLKTTESSAVGAGNVSNTKIETPQSVNLEFQSGVAANTLVFGSVRWVDWSEFDISPNDYGILTSGGSLVSYDEDTITYTIGVGRAISETLSLTASVSFEESQGGFSANLGPTDGRTGITLGARYSVDNVTLTGGISYVDIGDAQTTLGGGVAASDFTGNSAIGAGVRVGYTF